MWVFPTFLSYVLRICSQRIRRRGLSAPRVDTKELFRIFIAPIGGSRIGGSARLSGDLGGIVCVERKVEVVRNMDVAVSKQSGFWQQNKHYHLHLLLWLSGKPNHVHRRYRPDGSQDNHEFQENKIQ